MSLLMSISMNVLRSTLKAIKGCLLIATRSFVQQPVSAYPAVYMSAYPAVYMSTYPAVYMSTYPAVYMSAYPAVSLHLTWRNFHCLRSKHGAHVMFSLQKKRLRICLQWVKIYLYKKMEAISQEKLVAVRVLQGCQKKP